MRLLKAFQLIALAGVMTFPAVSRAVSPPAVLTDSVPDRWMYSEGLSQDFPTDDDWWQRFNDPLLDSLLRRGEEANFNLLQATRRIEMSRQALRSVRSAYYPQIGISAGWTKSRQSADNAAISTGRPVTVDYFSLGADASWQIDLFGRVWSQAREQKARISASRADYAAMSVSVCAEIASAYMQLRTLQQQLEVTRRHIDEQQRVLKIAEARYECSLASMLDVSQARTVYYSTLASITPLQTSIATTVNAIAVLVGEYPHNLAPRLLEPAAQPQPPLAAAAGVPAELLRRRPDIAQAESTLAAYAAAVGVAKKDFLPTLSINGSIGTQAHRFGDLMTNNSFIYAIAPTLSWTLFDGFARAAAMASAKEQMLAGIDAYNQTVLTAFQEAENAMVSYSNAIAYEQQMQQVVTNAQKAFELSLDRYKQGLDPFINVADAQISLLQYSNELVSARGQVLSALVALYRAFGGGWQETANN